MTPPDPLETAFESLSRSCPSRYTRYLHHGDNDKTKALLLYLWNLELCTALMPVLSGAEVMMKNTIDSAMHAHHGDPYWFVLPEYIDGYDQSTLLSRTLRDVNRKRKVLMYRGDIPNTDPEVLMDNIRRFNRNDIVAESPFRYWTQFLSHDFEHTVWKRINYPLLFHCPSVERPHRKEYQSRFNQIREIRNRAYHNEPIFDRNPDVVHRYAMENICWMNDDHGKITKITEPFHKLWEEGKDAFIIRMKDHLRTSGFGL